LLDLNTVGKCAIENFKKSNNREFVRVSTRNRYLKKRNNSRIKSLATISKRNNTAFVEKTVVKTVTSVDNTRESTKDVKKALVKDFIRFDQVNEIPMFVTCEDAALDIKQNCIKETFVANLLENFTYPFDAAAEGIEGTVWVRFIIDKDGYIKNITTTGPDNGKLLEQEAERLITLLPKFVPGKHNNDYVNVEYFMPIDFQLDE